MVTESIFLAAAVVLLAAVVITVVRCSSKGAASSNRSTFWTKSQFDPGQGTTDGGDPDGGR